MSAEDNVVLDVMLKINPKARIFTLDTGRLNQETYDVMDALRKKYSIQLEVMFPDATATEQMVRTKGLNLFYESIDNRKLCCGIRKVKPLRRALAGLSAWVTGLRREQTVTRSDTPVAEWDAGNGLIKVSPLARWTESDVWAYVKAHDVPYNALHDRGFPSIGCAPCTRAIQPGEDVRAGRWWWERPEQKECGLHVHK